MSAIQKIIQFTNELTTSQAIMIIDLMKEYNNEQLQDRLELIDKIISQVHAINEKTKLELLADIAELSADSKPFEVVAIAGTAETPLSNPHQTVSGC